MFPGSDVPVQSWRLNVEGLNVDNGAAPAPRLTVSNDVKHGLGRHNKNRLTFKTFCWASFACRRICSLSLRTSWLFFRVPSSFFSISSKFCDITCQCHEDVKSCEEVKWVRYTSSTCLMAAALSTQLLSSYPRDPLTLYRLRRDRKTYLANSFYKLLIFFKCLLHLLLILLEWLRHLQKSHVMEWH